MTSFKPLLIGGIGLPVLGGCGYAGYVFMQPTNLKEDLMSQKLNPLSTEKEQDKEDWIKLIKAYSKADSNPKMGNLTIKLSETPKPPFEPTEEQITQFQAECKSLFQKEKKKTNDNDYQTHLTAAKAWCVKDSEKIEKTTNP